MDRTRKCFLRRIGSRPGDAIDWTRASELQSRSGNALRAFAESFGAAVFELGVGDPLPVRVALVVRHGLQESLHQLGKTPAKDLWIDNSSAATHRIGPARSGILILSLSPCVSITV